MCLENARKSLLESIIFASLVYFSRVAEAVLNPPSPWRIDYSTGFNISQSFWTTRVKDALFERMKGGQRSPVILSSRNIPDGGNCFGRLFNYEKHFNFHVFIRSSKYESLHISPFMSFPLSGITNSQWPALQLAWLAKWIERCVRSSQRSGFHSRSSLN